ncbi:hypothetical protein GS501_02025 [Saccharibacter sp. 17.LH.SD]|uniref:hypothetical protein n=1 Tax=Saccharibacter sp. 17.LH.SD TaxID=2689393 RepID=UPI00137215F0|nr:hypothetical protein [Saccharibacter sp. 17.LH.SD]MXV43830.1 hypothetical protein [Saccharibacter sp. 17.LH.SD]
MSILSRFLSFRHLCTAFALTSSILAAPLAQAASCRSSSEVHNAFAIEGLKSELMVTALSCQAQGRYNDFIGRFRPVLTTAEKRLDTYFRSSYGRQAQKQHDEYITQLADVQSLGGLKSGTIFCDQRMPMFDEINALDTGDDLAHYAEAKDISQPASYESCAAPRSSSSHSRTRTRRHHR